MHNKPPPPLVQSFVVCREIYQALGSQDHILVGPFNRATFLRYPAAFRFAFYAYLADLQGRYEVGLRLEDEDDRVVWQWNAPQPVEHTDPLSPHRIVLYDIVAALPRPGRYHMVIAANGDELAHHVLFARLGGEATT